MNIREKNKKINFKKIFYQKKSLKMHRFIILNIDFFKIKIVK